KPATTSFSRLAVWVKSSPMSVPTNQSAWNGRLSQLEPSSGTPLPIYLPSDDECLRPKCLIQSMGFSEGSFHLTLLSSHASSSTSGSHCSNSAASRERNYRVESASISSVEGSPRNCSAKTSWPGESTAQVNARHSTAKQVHTTRVTCTSLRNSTNKREEKTL